MSTPDLPPSRPEQPAGWFPDPNGRHEHRYFNGRSWTADVADGGVRSIDPFGSAPPPARHVAPPTSPSHNGLATAALVCGIGAVLLAWMPFIVVAGFVLAVLALVFGVHGLRRSHESGAGRGPALAGVVLGALGVALSVIGVVLSVVAFREVRAFMNPAPHDAAVSSCDVADGVATAHGTLTNRGRTSNRFTVFVELHIGERRSEHADRIDSLAPGEAGDWRVTEFDVATGDTCTAEVHVFGPFPFDVPMDRP